MDAYLGVAAPTGPSQNRAGDGPKTSPIVRSGAGKEKAAKAAKKSSSMESSAGVTGGGGTTEGGATGVTGITDAETEAAPLLAPKSNNDATPAATGGKRRLTVQELYGAQPDDDMSNWVIDEGPFRIKKSLLTDDEKTLFKRHLDRIFSEEIIMGTRVNFDGDDVMEVMKKVIPYLESEPVLIEDLPFGISIVADIHGQLYDLKRVFCGDDKDGKPGWERGVKYLFLGDYVDRGRQSLEVVMALFCLKMLYPDDIFLLRGNHEFVKTNIYDKNTISFRQEMNERYELDDAKILYFQVNETFFYLSIAAILGDSYFCAHGGISPGFVTRQHMRGIYKPIKRSSDDVIVHDMTWSDPARGVFGATYNTGRGASSVYGYDSLVIAMACLGVKAVFRGHQVIEEGYESFWDVLYSLFTCTSQDVKGAVAVIDADGRLSMRVLIIDPKRVALEDAVRALNGHPALAKEEKSRYNNSVKKT